MEEINLNGQSLNLDKDNAAKLKELFPEAVIEGRIDFEKLKLLLGENIDRSEENYGFTWHGKRDALRKSQAPSMGTLRPCIEESRNWDTTRNLYIEGDNLEVLKLLQKSYSSKVKLIYIDPPYNKDKDFIYPDKWKDPIREYKRITGQIDEDGNITSSDAEEEGGRHTKWLNMMYPRLRLAKNLLKDDGIIFISIDDNEIANLKKLCNEIFGEENFIVDLIWTNKEGGGSSDSKYFRIKHEHILCYAKHLDNVVINGIAISNENRYKLQDEYVATRGKFYLQKLGMGSIQYSESLDYPIETPDGGYVLPADNNNGKQACWRWSKQKFQWGLKNGFIVIKKDSSGVWTVYTKQYLNCDNEGNIITRTQRPTGIIDEFSSTQAAKYLDSIGMGECFDYSKPKELIGYLLKVALNGRDSIVMDFFSGSGTTAQAVMEYNAQNNTSHRFIMVQLPENLDVLTEGAASASRKTLQKSIDFLNSINKPHYLSELGKERIRRAGDMIKKELKEKYERYLENPESYLEGQGEAPMNPENFDIGFKVFKLDSSNLKKWSLDVGEDFYKLSRDEQNAILSEKLGFEVDNFVEGRSEMDVVYEIMLKYGLDLTYPVETVNFKGKNVYSIGYGGLIVCLDREITPDLAEDIVDLVKELEPSTVRVAVRDLSFMSDSAKLNFKETLKNGIYSYFDSSQYKTDKQSQFKFITI